MEPHVRLSREFARRFSPTDPPLQLKQAHTHVLSQIFKNEKKRIGFLKCSQVMCLISIQEYSQDDKVIKRNLCIFCEKNSPKQNQA